MQDLVLLVADKNMHFALRGALARWQAMGTRSFTYEFRVHPGRDGGVRTSGSQVLARERSRFAHALMMHDLEGSGAHTADPLTVESDLNQELQATWGDDAKAIVIAPELDVWLWGADNALREVLQWPLDGPIRQWLQSKGFQISDDGKPARPKEALDAMRPIHKQPRSSALYEKITTRISLQNCTDSAFLRLRAQLQRWFPSSL